MKKYLMVCIPLSLMLATSMSWSMDDGDKKPKLGFLDEIKQKKKLNKVDEEDKNVYGKKVADGDLEDDMLGVLKKGFQQHGTFMNPGNNHKDDDHGDIGDDEWGDDGWGDDEDLPPQPLKKPIEHKPVDVNPMPSKKDLGLPPPLSFNPHLMQPPVDDVKGEDDKGAWVEDDDLAADLGLPKVEPKMDQPKPGRQLPSIVGKEPFKGVIHPMPKPMVEEKKDLPLPDPILPMDEDKDVVHEPKKLKVPSIFEGHKVQPVQPKLQPKKHGLGEKNKALLEQMGGNLNFGGPQVNAPEKKPVMVKPMPMPKPMPKPMVEEKKDLLMPDPILPMDEDKGVVHEPKKLKIPSLFNPRVEPKQPLQHPMQHGLGEKNQELFDEMGGDLKFRAPHQKPVIQPQPIQPPVNVQPQVQPQIMPTVPVMTYPLTGKNRHEYKDGIATGNKYINVGGGVWHLYNQAGKKVARVLAKDAPWNK